MSLLDNIFRRSENQVGTVIPQNVAGLGWSITHKKYADVYLWIILNRILRGLANVRFHPSEVVNNESSRNDIEGLCRFVENNINVLVYMLWTKGCAVIGRDDRKKKYFVPSPSDIRFDSNGKVMKYDNVVYSTSYSLTQKTDFDIIKENVKYIDIIKSADDYLTETLGAMAVMSGKAMPITEADKEDFQKEIKTRYGITRDKYQIMLMSHEVTLQQLSLPIKDLDLQGKVKEEMKAIAGYFGVPYDLIPFSGASTYANQEQAVKQFYSDCVSPIAETLLSLIRYMMRNKYMLPSYFTTFSIDNVPELEDDRMADIEYKLKVAELAEKMRDLGVDNEKYVQQLQNIEQ